MKELFLVFTTFLLSGSLFAQTAKVFDNLSVASKILEISRKYADLLAHILANRSEICFGCISPVLISIKRVYSL